MTTVTSFSPITSVNSAISTSTAVSQPSDDAVPTLPDPLNPLQGMLFTGDVGATVAALVMTTEKELRKAARTDRDVAYQAQENAQRQEIDHMKDAATTRLITGLAAGGLKIGSAVASAGALKANFDGASARGELAVLEQQAKNAPLNGQQLQQYGGLQERAAGFEKVGGDLGQTGKGLDVESDIVSAVGKFVSDGQERDEKVAANRAATFKRVAEGRADDVHDADKAIDKTMEFYSQWLTGKAAAESAAIHRA